MLHGHVKEGAYEDPEDKSASARNRLPVLCRDRDLFAGTNFHQSCKL